MIKTAEPFQNAGLTKFFNTKIEMPMAKDVDILKSTSLKSVKTVILRPTVPSTPVMPMGIYYGEVGYDEVYGYEA